MTPTIPENRWVFFIGFTSTTATCQFSYTNTLPKVEYMFILFWKFSPFFLVMEKPEKICKKKHIHYFHSQRFGVKNHRPQPFGVKRFKRRNAKTASKSSRLKGCFFSLKVKEVKKKHIFEIVPPEKKNRCFSPPPPATSIPMKKNTLLDVAEIQICGEFVKGNWEIHLESTKTCSS